MLLKDKNPYNLLTQIISQYMPLTPLDECAPDCCILVCTRDPHGMRASCHAQLLSGMLLHSRSTTGLVI